jgi:hypothetical protein
VSASTSCPNVFVDNQQISLYIIAGLLGFSLLFGVFRADNDTRRMYIVMILPLLDVVSDFLVILAVTFYDTILFALVIFFFLTPTYYFLYVLFDTHKYPRLTVLPIRGTTLFWLSCKTNNTGDSNNNNSPPGDWIYPHVDGIPWCKSILSIPLLGSILFIPTWLCFISLQGFYLFLSVILVVFNIPFQLLWLCFGILIFQTSLWSINRLWAVWLYVWCGEESAISIIKASQDDSFSISDPRLRTSIIYKLISETAFMLILQPINLILLNAYGYSTMIGTLFNPYY